MFNKLHLKLVIFNPNWSHVMTIITTLSEADSAYYIKLSGPGISELKSPMPQNFSLQLGSNWDTPFNRSLLDYAGGAASSAGMNTTSQMLGMADTGMRNITGQTSSFAKMSAVMMQSGSHLEFNIPFILKAGESGVDILDTMKSLLKAVAPKVENGFIKLKGPNIKSVAEGSFSTSAQGFSAPNADDGSNDGYILSIGKFMVVKPVVITAVNEEFDSLFDTNRSPISVTINVTLQTIYTVSEADIDGFFKV